MGVDGGGTKTAFCLLTADGEVAARLDGPSCYYLTGAEEGLDLVVRVLRDGVSAVCASAGVGQEDVAYAFFGLPAYGEVSGDLPALDAAAGASLGHDRFACGNDTVCAWAGSLGGADGINVVSGTGSITYGERAGTGVRVGGWGETFGDEGSGYWIGIRGLRAFSKMADGRAPEGPLLGVLREELALGTDLDLVDVVLNRWRSDRRRIAALSRAVVTAASRGDAAALGILDSAAAELAALVETTRRRLGFGDDELVPVSWSGGVFSAPQVREPFLARLRESPARYDVREPLVPPVLGAALHAAQLAGTPLAPSALDRLVAGVRASA
nr:BadF/BadG/BcrA/BcrD ATPase family protein [Motilibacter peucedani]